jgi:hypothetical protein
LEHGVKMLCDTLRGIITLIDIFIILIKHLGYFKRVLH